MSSKNLLDDNLIDDNNPYRYVNFQIADKISRFLNSFLDTIILYAIILLYTFFSRGFIAIMPEDIVHLMGVSVLFIYLLYYTVFEYAFGRTPGKFLTSTYVLMKDGSRPSFSNILIRSLGRLIPFNRFSFLFLKKGWHDQISNTVVVYKRR